MSKKIISIILSLVLVLGMCCISAFAETGDNALLGDVDSDREVTVKDATLLQLYLAKFKGDSDIDLSVADYSQDGYINVLDVTYIQLYIANLLPQNPVDDIAYHVAGDLVEPTWDPVGGPLMIKGEYEYDGNSYDYSYEIANLEAGSYNFKITNGRSWDTDDKGNPVDPLAESWGNGESNYNFTLSAACPVTIYFNSQTKEIAVSAENLTNFEFEYITAVGGGSDSFLNGANWVVDDPSNRMTEVEGQPGVYEISYENVYADIYQVKFACNGSWSVQWGAPSGETYTGKEIKFIGEGGDNPSNINFDVAEDASKVTLRIDLSGFNFSTKEGEVPITILVKGPNDADTEPTSEATQPTSQETQPTSQETEPTSEATQPTSQQTEPTSEETQPTSEATQPTSQQTEPTSEETQPTSQQTEPTSEETQPTSEETQPTSEETDPPVPEKKYYVAGDMKLTGAEWDADAEANLMTKGEYTYKTKTYDYIKEYSNIPLGSYALKITDGQFNTDNSKDHEWGAGGINDSQNVSFNTSASGYVKIYFNSTSGEIAVDAQYASSFKLTKVVAVGGGSGKWLNGESWSVNSTKNIMKDDDGDGVYEITYTGVSAGTKEFKIACNGSYTYNWGSPQTTAYTNKNNYIKGQFNSGNNIKFTVSSANSTVKLGIDFNNYNFDKKSGYVVIKIIVRAPGDEDPEPDPSELKRTIYFDNSKTKWSSVYLYGFAFGLNNEFVKMEKVDEERNIWAYTYEYSLPVDGQEGLIFVNKNSWSNQYQTKNLATQAGKNLFVPSSTTGTSISGTWDVYTPAE